MTNNKNILISVILLFVSLSACVQSLTTAVTQTPQDSISNILTMQQTLTAQVPSDGESTEVNEDATQATQDPLVATATSTLPAATATATLGATAAATQPQTVPTKHTLQSREYPYCIARRYDVHIDALLNANGLVPASLYEEGLVLTIPQNAAPFAGQRELIPHPTQYTVLGGDTLYWIACKFGDVYPEAIAQANGFGVDVELTVGQVIQIP